MANAELRFADKHIELPVIEGTEGETAIDISKLRAQTGAITLDNGFLNTGACESQITFVDGENGILRYRGYAIEDICRDTNFLETSYMLIFGQMPSQEEYNSFRAEVMANATLHEDVATIVQNLPNALHPMAALISATPCLSAFYGYDGSTAEGRAAAAAGFIGRLPTMIAQAHRARNGKSIVAPDPSLSYTGNFLNMMFAGEGAYKDGVDPDIARALDILLLLHADHEQNCSTSTMRVVSSSQANLYASASAAMSALWGPLHGGANQAVIEMLERIQNDGGDVEKYIGMAKDKSNAFRLMGFGHRVYKNFDPRAKIIKQHATNVLDKLGVDDPLLDIAKKLEAAALADDYFVQRKLFPNVDFYSGIIYKAMGIPTDVFTVMFALGRLPGWIAQSLELMNDPRLRISRPRQVYQGPTLRPLESKVENYG